MRTELVYLDNNNNVVEKEAATKAIIKEIDENGKLIREIFGKVDNTIDEEEIDIIDEN